MFISKAEKNRIIDALQHVDKVQDTLAKTCADQAKLISYQATYLKNLEKRIAELENIRTIKDKNKNKHKDKWTPERRKAQGDLIRKMWADKKAKKLGSANVMGAPV